MNIIGDSGALQEAMARRATQGGSVMNQQSPASAGFDPSMTPPPSASGSALPPISATPSPLPSSAGVPVSPTQTMGNDEAQLIIKTLSKRLDAITPPKA